jgi:hypothetical protein
MMAAERAVRIKSEYQNRELYRTHEISTIRECQDIYSNANQTACACRICVALAFDCASWAASLFC